MYKLFLTAHTPRGTFTGAITNEVSQEEAYKLLLEFQKNYLEVRSVTLYQLNSPTPILISGRLLIESVLSFEVRDVRPSDFEDFDF